MWAFGGVQKKPKKLDPERSRLVKVVLPTTSHWGIALANARPLRRNRGFENVFIRRSMTAEERKQDYELRKLTRERNSGKVMGMGSVSWAVETHLGVA